MLLSFPAWRASHIFREGNRPADWLISLAMHEGAISWNHVPTRVDTHVVCIFKNLLRVNMSCPY